MKVLRRCMGDRGYGFIGNWASVAPRTAPNIFFTK